MNHLDHIMGEFHPVPLGDLGRVGLMNRVDVKYMFHRFLLPEILSEVTADYRVLSIDDIRMFRYRTLYYDTPALRFYIDHHNGLRPRYKVRFREYLDTGQTFLEVKLKTNTERTCKSRMKVDGIESRLSPASLQFISERVPGNPASLMTTLDVRFIRITLVSESDNERITIDQSPGFGLSGSSRDLPGLVISEVKKDNPSGLSHFMRLLKQHHILPVNLSKYCLGIALLRDEIRINRFKEKIYKINRLENEYAAGIAAG